MTDEPIARVLPKPPVNKLLEFNRAQLAADASGLREELELLALGRAFQLLRDGSPLTQELVGIIQALNGNLRPSQGKGRVHVEGHVVDSTVNELIVHTVTPGKTLWMTSMNFSMEGASSILAVHDGPESHDLHKFGFRTPSPANSFVNVTGSFPEPKPFYTDVRMHIHTGTPSYTFDFTGYEE